MPISQSNNQQLNELVEKLRDILLHRQWKIATAESCTGGGLAYWLTHLAGSSDWFDCGFVSYSNDSKINLLNVNPSTLEKHGAVSQATAIQMANGGLANSDADICVSITGVAGPSRGSAAHPVGTVWTAYSSAHFATYAQLFQLEGTRENIRECAIIAVLKEVLTKINTL